ncbi:hypothetical protein WJX74_004787 [Apatococcus lobatus]|uniref:Uncharacterized protein n=1 Tax=Apatococcus lobatus TaxID=904363 RepID=A0AAW1QD38_9CHLO
MVRLSADVREMLSTSEFLHWGRDMERALEGKVSYQSALGVAAAFVGSYGFFFYYRLRSMKEEVQQAIQLTTAELKKDISLNFAELRSDLYLSHAELRKAIAVQHVDLKQVLDQRAEQVRDVNSTQRP